MSLINRMLSDLEERRGGNLRNVDHAIDGLRATQGPTPRRKKRIAPATVVTGCVIAGLVVLCGYLFVSRPSTSTMVQAPAATPVPEPTVMASAPASAPQTPVIPTPAAAAPASVTTQPMPVVITDIPPAAAEPVQRVADPPPATPRTETPPPEPARDIAAAWPEPEPAPEPARAPPTRQRMLSTGSSGEREEPLVETASRAPRAPERPPADNSSFHIAEATPRSAADEALALLEEGDAAGAESLLREGLANAPGDSDMARVLGHILLARNEASAAVQVLRPAAPTVEADPDFNALLAAAEQRSGAHDQAIRRYRSLLEQKPGNGAWLVGLGISLRANGDVKAASDAFLQALADTSLPAPLHDFAMQQATQVREGQP